LIRRIAYLVGFMLLAMGSLFIVNAIVMPLIFLILGIFSFVFYPTYFNWLLQRKVARTYRDESRRTTLDTRVLRVTDQGIEEKSDLGEIKVKWDAIDSIESTPGYAIISIRSVPSIIVPEARMSSGDYTPFVNACRQYLKDKAAYRLTAVSSPDEKTDPK